MKNVIQYSCAVSFQVFWQRYLYENNYIFLNNYFHKQT
jgi:hypothetical protein